jgi:hypothetical protein
MLFTSASKLQQIEKEIDVARCKGRWQAIPDLARRYVKHNPQGKGKTGKGRQAQCMLIHVYSLFTHTIRGL